MIKLLGRAAYSSLRAAGEQKINKRCPLCVCLTIASFPSILERRSETGRVKSFQSRGMVEECKSLVSLTRERKLLEEANGVPTLPLPIHCASTSQDRYPASFQMYSMGFWEMMVHRLDPSSSAHGLLMAVIVSVNDLIRISPFATDCSWIGGVLIAKIGELDLLVLAASPFSTSRSVSVERC